MQSLSTLADFNFLYNLIAYADVLLGGINNLFCDVIQIIPEIKMHLQSKTILVWSTTLELRETNKTIKNVYLKHINKYVL